MRGYVVKELEMGLELAMIYEDACRVVNQCCFALAQNGEETDRESLIEQVRIIHRDMMVKTGEPNVALRLAIEQLGR